MQRMTRNMVIRLLALLKHAAKTSINGIRLWANTDYDSTVVYNPYINDGEWELVKTNTGDISASAKNMDNMIDTIMKIDNDYINSLQ